MPLTLERQGERLFHDARLCRQQWQSCASCHQGGGRLDGLNWDLLNDGTGNAKNTRSLLFSHQTPPVMITGIRPDAETAVRAGMRAILFAEANEAQAQAIDAYLKSLRPVPSPYLVNGQLSEAAQRGQAVFDRAGCAYCHPPSLYTDRRSHDVGTGRMAEAGRAFDTPTLIELWRTAPYQYDGDAATVGEIFLQTRRAAARHRTPVALNPEELSDLTALLLSL